MKKIVLIGSGNVGTHLAQKLKNIGFNDLYIYSRRLAKAQQLANSVGAEYGNVLPDIPTNADLYILAVSDDAIDDVAQKMPLVEGIVAHTSGAMSMNKLFPQKRIGIFYPLQTFKKEKEVFWEKLPFCIHASTAEIILTLENLAKRFTSKVYRVDDQQRSMLHVAAVFANNFSNHMLAIAEDICQSHQLDFDILLPLIQATFEGVQVQSPAKAQTGPAIREDEDTIQKHLSFLEKEGKYQDLYIMLSKSIIKNKNT